MTARIGQRQHHRIQGAEVGRAVHIGRFLQLVGDGVHKERAHNHHVIDGDGGGENHDGEGVEEPQVADGNVGGDKPAAEEHGEHHHAHDQPLALEVAAGQRICRSDGQHDVQRRARQGIGNGVAVSRHDLRVLKDHPVRFQAEPGRLPNHLAGQHVHGVGYRRNDDEIQRIQHNQHGDGQKNVHAYVEEAVSCGTRFHVLPPPYHRLVSLTRRAIWLTVTSRMQLTTELNRLTAAE